MMKTFGKITLAGILAAMIVGAPVRLLADDNASKPAAPATKSKSTQFHGKLAAVDSTAKTITVEYKTQPKRTLEISSDTKISKDGKPATLSDGTVGDDVHGTYTTGADNKLTAKTVVFGKAPAKKPAAAPTDK